MINKYWSELSKEEKNGLNLSFKAIPREYIVNPNLTPEGILMINNGDDFTGRLFTTMVLPEKLTAEVIKKSFKDINAQLQILQDYLGVENFRLDIFEDYGAVDKFSSNLPVREVAVLCANPRVGIMHAYIPSGLGGLNIMAKVARGLSLGKLSFSNDLVQGMSIFKDSLVNVVKAKYIPQLASV